MIEVCFCGWSGETAAREPSYLGEGEWGLTCPRCGHLDRLDWLPAAARDALIAAARDRHAEWPAAGTVTELPDAVRLSGRASA
jgi:hypothetical protein